MSLSGENAHKFAAYTLFCHCLVKQLSRLDAATRAEKHLSLDDCVKAIDNVLRMLFEQKIFDRQQAVGFVSLHLSAYASGVKPTSPKVAGILERAVANAVRLSAGWSYERAIELCDDQGRRLAQIFFEKSTWPETKNRLSKQARLHYEHGDPNIRELARALADKSLPSDLRERLNRLIEKYETRLKDAYDMRTASLYTFENEKDGDYTIYVPFDSKVDKDTKDIKHGFMHYVSYPFLFMHEYAAHIFSTDYNNDRFNDGWMLYAPSLFLIRNWRRPGSKLSFLNKQQVYAFKRYLVGRLKGRPKKDCEFAEEFDSFLTPWAPQKFDEISFELAAYVPTRSQTDTWPTKLLRRLADEHFDDPNSLEKRMRNASSLDLLYPGLKDETDIWQ